MHLAYNEDVRRWPLVVEGDQVPPEPRCSPPCPLPWLYEFSWDGSSILFAGDPLNVSQRPGHSSEAAGATSGGTNVGGNNGVSEPTVIPSSTASCSSTNSVALRARAFHRGQVMMAVVERRMYLLRQLQDYYHRTHPPLSSANRDYEDNSQTTSGRSSSSNQASESRSAGKRRCSGKEREVGGGSGNGEGDDEGDDNSQSASNPTQLKSLGLRFACPYLKRNAIVNVRCWAGFRNIYEMKVHLEEKHFVPSCSKCGVVLDDKDLLRIHHSKECIRGPRDRPLNGSVITPTQLAIIKKRPRQAGNPEEQWRRIFGILFPGHPPPSSVYLKHHMDEIQTQVEEWRDRAGKDALRKLQQRACQNDELFFIEPQSQQADAVFDEFCARFIEEAMSSGVRGSDLSLGRPDFNNNTDLPCLPASESTASNGTKMGFLQPETEVSCPALAGENQHGDVSAPNPMSPVQDSLISMFPPPNLSEATCNPADISSPADIFSAANLWDTEAEHYAPTSGHETAVGHLHAPYSSSSDPWTGLDFSTETMYPVNTTLGEGVGCGLTAGTNDLGPHDVQTIHEPSQDLAWLDNGFLDQVWLRSAPKGGCDIFFGQAELRQFSEAAESLVEKA